MRVLVTGGAGFIGSNFVRHLLSERTEVEVVNLDKLTYAGTLANLEDVEDGRRHTFVHADICDAEAVDEVMEGTDLIFNLAAESHVDRSIEADTPFVRTNVVGTAVLLSAALRHGVRRFVQVSTDEVYGELPWRDPAESASRTDAEPAGGRDTADPAPRFTEDTPLQPRSPYSATKAAADHLVQSYHTTHGLDVVITRCSNNYGPYQYPEKLIPLMITRALADEPLPVYGDGLHVRDWIHVSDHCAGLLAAAERGRPGRVYNFGGDAERTNISVVRTLLGILGKPESLMQHVTDRPGHDRRYAIDFSRAETELGWRPTHDFEEGLADTVQWYMENEAWSGAVVGR
jgi:dTDP-glucose 4,6-dehydratase